MKRYYALFVIALGILCLRVINGEKVKSLSGDDRPMLRNIKRAANLTNWPAFPTQNSSWPLTGSTKQPIRFTLNSTKNVTSSAWISTIKGIGVCWCIVAFIWVFFRLSAHMTYYCQQTWYTIHPSPEIINSYTRVAQHRDLERQTDSEEYDLKSIRSNGMDVAPPEYEQFLPPTYDQVMQTRPQETLP